MPGNNLELQAVDEERFTAAALFGLAGSQQGLAVLLSHPGQVLTGVPITDVFRRDVCLCQVPDIVASAAGTARQWQYISSHLQGISMCTIRMCTSPVIDTFAFIIRCCRLR